MARYFIRKQDLINYVEIELDNSSVRTESGAMRYYQGNIDMQTKMPSIGGMLKSKFSGENVFRPVYSGTGKLVLEPSFNEFFMLPLDNEEYIIDKGAYLASDMSVEIGVRFNKVTNALLSGEGWVQTMVKGRGYVVVMAPGPVKEIDLFNDRLVVDGNFAVARSSSLKFSTQTSTRSLFGTAASGEVLVQVLEGTGKVYLAPIPNYPALMQNLVVGGVANFFMPLFTGKK